jgi:hypothetical protein
VSSQVCRALRITKVRARRGDHIGETVTRGCPSIPRCMEMFQGPSRSELQRLELNSKADGTESSFVQLLETLQPGNGMARALQKDRPPVSSTGHTTAGGAQLRSARACPDYFPAWELMELSGCNSIRRQAGSKHSASREF